MTLNYDDFVEQAYTELRGKTFHSLDDYLRDPQCRIAKLHGSIDWWGLIQRKSAPLVQDRDSWWEECQELDLGAWQPEPRRRAGGTDRRPLPESMENHRRSSRNARLLPATHSTVGE
ncbi:MAG: SIR2 family protein [Dehalococcoidia bacterium]|nr:SIR2 family protein [Dehalococcoidia bacterium]